MASKQVFTTENTPNHNDDQALLRHNSNDPAKIGRPPDQGEQRQREGVTPMPTPPLKGKVALVTGAGRGPGRAFADLTPARP